MRGKDLHYQILTRPLPGGLCAFALSGAAEQLARAECMMLKHNAARCSTGSSPTACATDPSATERLTGRVQHGRLVDPSGVPVDDVLLATPKDGPHLLTGHGGATTVFAIRSCLEAWGFADASVCGFRFGSGNRIEREADALLPQCRTTRQVRLVLSARAGLSRAVQEIIQTGDPARQTSALRDLLRRGERAQRILSSHHACLVGAPNAGKSSLFNRLVDEDRALVHDEAGTTRDAVEDWIDLNGLHVLLSDTAGLREAAEVLEREAQGQTLQRMRSADVALLVIDASGPLSGEDRLAATTILEHAPQAARIIVLNKCDLAQTDRPERQGLGERERQEADRPGRKQTEDCRSRQQEELPASSVFAFGAGEPESRTNRGQEDLLPDATIVRVSAFRPDAPALLAEAVATALGVGEDDDGAVPITERQMTALREALQAVQAGRSAEQTLGHLTGEA